VVGKREWRNVYKILGRKPERKRPLVRPRLVGSDNHTQFWDNYINDFRKWE